MGKRRVSPQSDVWSRRAFLRAAGLGVGAVAVGGLPRALRSQILPGTIAQYARPARLTLTAAPSTEQILPGGATNVWRFTAQRLAGPYDTVTPIPGSYLGPILRGWKGQRFQIRFQNNLSEESVVHWHGLDVPPSSDGHPRNAVGPGSFYNYDFTIVNRAGTYLYHPHPDMLTGEQVFRGLAGLFIVHDAEERAAGLPKGACDVPIVIQDRRFDVGNQFLYNVGGMAGFLGDQILVNGVANYELECYTRAYRLRIANVSNSRVYKLGWGDGSPMIVVGSDGGLLESPVEKPYLMLAPGERVEVWLDLRNKKVGDELLLKSLQFSAQGPSGGQLPVNGAPLDIMNFKVVYQQQETLVLPPYLSQIDRYDVNQAVNRDNPRVFQISVVDGMFRLNGRLFEMKSWEPDEEVRLGDLEVWEFRNDSSGMRMIHPMHTHGPPFQVLERTIDSMGAANYETVRYGYVDEGWKDTIMVMPGERVKVLIKFTHFSGLYIYHCHNLEHEDMGMMRNYYINP